MPRKIKKKPAELEQVIERSNLKPASEIPKQLEPPEPQLEALPNASARVKAILAGQKQAEPRTHTEAVAASRPQFRPVPQGFINTARFETAGIRINKDLDRGIAALQFSEDRLPTRAEKDILEAVGQAESGFSYKPSSRQWERETAEGTTVGENIIDATRIAGELAREREGRGR